LTLAGGTGWAVVDDDTDTGTAFTGSELDDGALGQGSLGKGECPVEALKISFNLWEFRLFAGGNLLAHALKPRDLSGYGMGKLWSTPEEKRFKYLAAVGSGRPLRTWCPG
jgi:hypothetical protein